jgi:uncharacterized protein YjbI with pentapeptide repeats
MLMNRNGEVLEAEPLRDGMDLSGRNLRCANFRNMILDGLDLSGAELKEADFYCSNLYWLNLFNSDCRGVSFYRATLEGVNFKSACLRRVDFSEARILPDRLGRASSFAHADLTDATLVGAILAGTEYDSKTIFPSGFEPETHGMVLVEVKDDWLLLPACKDD